jgi:hypothetical protein
MKRSLIYSHFFLFAVGKKKYLIIIPILSKISDFFTRKNSANSDDNGGQTNGRFNNNIFLNSSHRLACPPTFYQGLGVLLLVIPPSF